MNKLDNAIAEIGWILDALSDYRDILQSGCCNNCENRNKCGHTPKAGQLVRYNCPFYVRQSEEKPLDDKKFYEFLWNIINPNQMEEYLMMFNSTGEKTDGSDGQN